MSHFHLLLIILGSVLLILTTPYSLRGGLPKRLFKIYRTATKIHDKAQQQHTHSYHRFQRHSSKLQSSKSEDMNWDPKSAPKLDFKEDYYKVLEVSPDIDTKELKKAFYKMVFDYHPDRKKTEEEKKICNRQMMVINNAYTVLKDEKTRKLYDFQQNQKETFNSSTSSSSSSKTTNQRRRRSSFFDEDDEDEIPNYGPIYGSGSSTKSSSSSTSSFDKSAFANSFRDEDELFADAFDYFRERQEDDAMYGVPASFTAQGLKTKLANLRKKRDDKDSAVMNDPTDWGAVTDLRRIEQRLRSIDEVKRMDELIVELQGELDYKLYQEKQRQQEQARAAYTGNKAGGQGNNNLQGLWERLVGGAKSSNEEDDDMFSEIFQEKGPEEEMGGQTWRRDQARRRITAQSSPKNSKDTVNDDIFGGGGFDERSTEAGTAAGDEAVREELDRLLKQMRRR